MVIKLTVQDNDFTPDIENFADNLLDRLFKLNIEEISELNERLHAHEQWQRVMNLLNPNVTESLSGDDKQFLKSIIFAKWNKYVESTISGIGAQEYLKKNFKVWFGFRYIDKWENGESVYYFTKSQKWLTQ